jgi:hypothetical protein
MKDLKPSQPATYSFVLKSRLLFGPSTSTKLLVQAGELRLLEAPCTGDHVRPTNVGGFPRTGEGGVRYMADMSTSCRTHAIITKRADQIVESGYWVQQAPFSEAMQAHGRWLRAARCGLRRGRRLISRQSVGDFVGAFGRRPEEDESGARELPKRLRVIPPRTASATITSNATTLLTSISPQP